MKRNILYLIVLICFLQVTLLSQSQYHSSNKADLLNKYNTQIRNDLHFRNIVSQINEDSIRSYMLELERFKTRYALAQNRDTVVNWITKKILSFGYPEVEIDSFLIDQNIWGKNISVTIKGTNSPEILIVSGAHYDSFSYSTLYTAAPGADDNGGGSAAILEMARVLKINQAYSSRNTIKLVLFGAEEVGLLGSKYLAEKSKRTGQKLKLMINHDMIANTESCDTAVRVIYYPGFATYARYFCHERFNNLPVIGVLSRGGKSDYNSFGTIGIPAISFQEYDVNDRYHLYRDSVKYCNIKYCTHIAMFSLSSLLLSANSPDIIQNLTARNLGDGHQIRLLWNSSKEHDHKSYKVYIGSEVGIYDSSIITADTNVVISSLKDSVNYYFGISDINISNMEGFMQEVSITTGRIPMSPKVIKDYPERDKIILAWDKNLSEDISGYFVYRKSNTAKEFEKLNSAVIKDSMYIDKNVNDNTYYYFITCIDMDGNESPQSPIIKTHPVTLNHGILIVDDTYELPGDQFNDAEIDSFYSSLVREFEHANFDITSEIPLKFSDLCAYSVILWHNDTFLYGEKNTAALSEYLKYGGNFIFTGYRISDFHSKLTTAEHRAFAFKTGDFIYDYLKIESIRSLEFSCFSGASAAENGYFGAELDKSRTKLSELTNIESIQPGGEAKVIYKYNSAYDINTKYGEMKGMPVGLEYISSNYKAIILNFPLFYINTDQASSILRYILKDKLTTRVALDKNDQKINQNVLFQNYPNPFNQDTQINYELSENVHIKIEIFDLLGRRIDKLFDGYQEAGIHSAVFNGSNLPSGTYYYAMHIGEKRYCRKMVLLK